MGSAQGQPAGPDLTQGIGSEELGDGSMLAGHVGDNAILLARRGRVRNDETQDNRYDRVKNYYFAQTAPI